MSTPVKYKLLRETYEQIGYQFTLERNGRSDWAWRVVQPYSGEKCQERMSGVASTKVRAMKASIAAIQALDS